MGTGQVSARAGSGRRPARSPVEWPTLALLALCYGAWALGTTWAAALWLPLGIVLTALAGALHSSLSHEIIHGHPFGNQHLNAVLVFPALSLFIPYLRFRDTHLAHHRDEFLTDPYDDPETKYLDPAVWARLPRILRAVAGAQQHAPGAAVARAAGRAGGIHGRRRACDPGG